MIPGLSTGSSAKNMISALISAPLSQLCTYKDTYIMRETNKEKYKFTPSCPTIHSCLNDKILFLIALISNDFMMLLFLEVSLNRHGKKYDANQFIYAMQRFLLDLVIVIME